MLVPSLHQRPRALQLLQVCLRRVFLLEHFAWFFKRTGLGLGDGSALREESSSKDNECQ